MKSAAIVVAFVVLLRPVADGLQLRLDGKTLGRPVAQRAAIALCDSPSEKNTPPATDAETVQSDAETLRVPPPEEKETVPDALKRVFFSEFGAQVAGVTVLFAAFLGLSTSLLNDEFWLTPF